jgi:hypothetical protein
MSGFAYTTFNLRSGVAVCSTACGRFVNPEGASSHKPIPDVSCLPAGGMLLAPQGDEACVYSTNLKPATLLTYKLPASLEKSVNSFQYS